jgi:protein TonB
MRFLKTILIFLIPVSAFCQDNLSNTPMVEAPVQSDTAIVELAEFPGGNERMANFVRHNLNHPKEVKKVKGEVWIQAVVEKEGNLTNLKVIQSLHPVCDKEAIRAVKIMPPWKPARHDGKIVRCRVKFPIKFG